MHGRREFIERAALLAVMAGGWLAPRWSGAAPAPEFYNLPPGEIDAARVLTSAPASIVTNGRLNLGAFDRPVRKLNIKDADLFQQAVKEPLRRARMQEFIGWGVTSPDWHLGIIIIDIQALGVAAFYAVDRRSGECFQYEYFGGRKNVVLSPSVYEGVSRAEKPGFLLEFRHHLDEGRHEIVFEAEESRNKPAVSLKVDFLEDLGRVQPLVVSLPVEPRHYFYTHKCAAPVCGRMKIGAEKVEFDPARDSGTMDEHRNYYPFPNRWFFGCFSGFDRQGRLVGVNMCDNAVQDQEHWNENCLWVDDKISLLGPVRFDFDRKDPMRPWRMSEIHGRLELTLEPHGGNEPVVIPPAGFSYYQKVGAFHGFAIDDSGEKHEIEGSFGEAEDFELGQY